MNCFTITGSDSFFIIALQCSAVCSSLTLHNLAIIPISVSQVLESIL